jgi:hypothetical protein
MRLDPLYRLRFHYDESWFVELEGEGGVESRHFLIAEGRVWEPLPERPRYDSADGD